MERERNRERREEIERKRDKNREKYTNIFKSKELLLTVFSRLFITSVNFYYEIFKLAKENINYTHTVSRIIKQTLA